MVSGPRSRGVTRLSGRRIRSDSVLPSIRRCRVRGQTRGRRPPRQDHHRGHHEVAGKLGLRKNHHQRGPTSRRQLLHGEGGVAPGQQSSIPATRRRRRRRVRDRDEQENSDVCLAYTRGILRSAVRQDAHAAVLLRLHRHIRGASSVPILRDGYG